MDGPDALCGYPARMLSHMSNRYSMETVRRWRFELVYNTVFDGEKAAVYWELHQRIQAVLDRFGCKKLIGAGLSLGNVEGIRQFYRLRPKEQRGQPLLSKTYHFTRRCLSFD